MYAVQIQPAAEVPPFDWVHANLQPLREFLQEEINQGRFVPVSNIPL